MSLFEPTLHMLCGKMASGKSTLALELSKSERTVLISEDVWLAALFSGEMSSASDYVRCASKLRKAMGPHVTALLNAGVSVVLDFPANTVENRNWMHGILKETASRNQLHVFDVADDVCLARLRKRNAGGEHPFAPTEAQFHQFSRYFVAPTPEEGFNIVVHRDARSA